MRALQLRIALARARLQMVRSPPRTQLSEHIPILSTAHNIYKVTFDVLCPVYLPTLSGCMLGIHRSPPNAQVRVLRPRSPAAGFSTSSNLLNVQATCRDHKQEVAQRARLVDLPGQKAPPR